MLCACVDVCTGVPGKAIEVKRRRTYNISQAEGYCVQIDTVSRRTNFLSCLIYVNNNFPYEKLLHLSNFVSSSLFHL